VRKKYMPQEVTREELLERLQPIAPVVREHADWGEQHGHLADPIVEAICDADLYRMLVPRELGGLEVDPLTFYQVVEALARIDGSTGWCMFINGGGPFSAMFLRDEAAESILGNGTCAIMAGTVFPFGRAVPYAGGYRVTTHGVYASGCWHANWFLAACNIYEDGGAAPRLAPSGMPELVFVYLPRAQVRILDTWDVSGLCATGSHDIVIENVFVPEPFVWKVAPGVPKGPRYSAATYRFPFMGLFSWPMSAVALGIAQAAIDEISGLSRHKTPRLATVTLHEKPLFQTQFAQAVALANSARAWLHAVIGRLWEKSVRGEAVSPKDRAAGLLAATNATRSAAAAIELAYTAGGGSANYRRSPLQRHMRDIHAVTQHIGTSPAQYETSGRMLLGLPPDTPLILL
jgi:alkylation response protein AidB-like acyl-CoA dehydrogenase